MAHQTRAGALLLLASLAACTETPASGVPTTVLAAPDAEIAHDFVGVSSLAEVGDRRVLIADEDDHSLWLADFTTKLATKQGRVGDGPGEFRVLGHVYAITDDSTLVGDLMNARFLVFTGGVLSATPRAIDMQVINTNPVAVDRAGRVYAQSPTFNKDSVPVMRWNPGTGRTDTVTYALTESAHVMKGPSSAGEETLQVCAGPHPRGDLWGAFPDGTVIVARSRDYHVESFSPDGHRTTGERVPVAPIAVPSSERKGACGDHEKNLQPFYGKQSQHQSASADGSFWVRRTTKHEDDPERYDVFSKSAALVRQVVLPRQSRLVGIGVRGVYAVRTDAGGAERLQRFRLR